MVAEGIALQSIGEQSSLVDGGKEVWCKLLREGETKLYVNRLHRISQTGAHAAKSIGFKCQERVLAKALISAEQAEGR